jgi:hypothetical protein
MQRIELDDFLASNTKISSKWSKDLSIRPNVVKFLKDKIREKLLDLSLSHEFFGFSTKSTGKTTENGK